MNSELYTLDRIKTASDVKHYLSEESHFFDRGTMRFFGDTMASFAVRRIDGRVIMYRKPSARVNVFGKVQVAGRTFFNCYEVVIDPNIKGRRNVELSPIYDEADKNTIFNTVVRRARS